MLDVNGKKVVVLGRFAGLKKADIEKTLKELGANVVRSLSKQTELLFAGAGTEDKCTEAESLGVTIAGEEELKALLEGDSAQDEGLLDVMGKTVVITGKFNELKRDQIALALEARGAKVSGSVSSKTGLLIAGERAGSKLKKAESYGVPVLRELALKKILDQEATVEVKPKPKKTTKVPEELEGKTFSTFANKQVCITGTLHQYTRAQVKAVLEESGATVKSGVNKSTQVIISGDKWGNKLRDAIAYGATVWTEGELLLLFEERDRHAFPAPEDVPNGENLSKLDAVEEGQTEFSTPEGVKGKLVLHWKKVPFKVHRRFGELFGFMYLQSEFSWVGKFTYNGKEMTPAPDEFYGAESFNNMGFWEDGSDTDGENLTYDGKHGFNCSCLGDLTRKKLHVNWARYHRNDNAYVYELTGPTNWFGDVCSAVENESIVLDFKANTFAVNHHMGPYIIRPERPYGD